VEEKKVKSDDSIWCLSQPQFLPFTQRRQQPVRQHRHLVSDCDDD